VLIEKILPLEKAKHYPVCLTGKRACPPEDCGGIWGYAGFLEAMHDPQHPEHEEMLEWVGSEFDPDAFDLDEVLAAGRPRLRDLSPPYTAQSCVETPFPKRPEAALGGDLTLKRQFDLDEALQL
jgi:hypothetical protein